MNLKGKNFLKMLDFTPEEIEGMIDLAADLKAKKKQVLLMIRCAARTSR